MDKAINTLEIGQSGVKLVIGYQIEQKPVVLYANVFSYENAIRNGEIIEPTLVTNAIKALVEDAKVNLGTNIEDVVLALPAIDLDIYAGHNQTNLVGSKVDKIDITNLTSQFRKSKIDPQKQIISIVPISFKTDTGRVYTRAPLGEPTSLLELEAFFHVLPLWIYNSYLKVVENAGLRILKTFVEAYALGELYGSQKHINPNFIVVDLAGERTTVSFFGNGRLFFSKHFRLGGQQLTEKIARAFDLNVKDAEVLKKTYGYDINPIKTLFNLNPSSIGKKVTIRDLEKVIKEYLDEHQRNLEDTFAILAQSQKLKNFESFQIILTGGASKLYGYPQYLASHAGNNKYIFAHANIIGARQPEYTTCLGLIKAYTRYALEIGDEQTPVGPLSRK